NDYCDQLLHRPALPSPVTLCDPRTRMKAVQQKSDVTLSVIVPAYNERDTVGGVIRRILAEIPFSFEVIVIDDGSTDGTGEVLDGIAAQDGRVRVVHQENGGKTAALKRGFE